MHNIRSLHTAALTVAGALVLAAMPSSHAAPVPSAAAAVGQAAPNHVIDVQARPRASRYSGGRHYGGGYRGYGYHGWGWGYPFGAGLIAGGIAAGAYPYYYSRPYYYAPAPVFVAPAPAYVEPGYGPNGPVRQCWVATDRDRGFGYWQPC